ncbi:MAG: glycoside hydrolase [Chitinophagaceae bacterium]|nr:MAG: glycoside hydrolase [Chitinophagaceae bacterium]
MIKPRKLLTSLILLLIFSVDVHAKDFNIAGFGARNDGVTLNTNIIQGAIDYITGNGGGRLVFDSGVYVTGSIYLKSNVILYLKEGAELRSSGNPFDFQKNKYTGWTSMIFAIKQSNIGIMGKGTINGLGYVTANNLVTYIHLGLVTDPLNLDRPSEVNRPANIDFKECTNIKITGITLKNPASWNQIYDQCRGVYVDNIRVDSKSYWNNDGIDIVDCDGVTIKNSSFDAADDVLCFKSFDPSKVCQNVVVDSCVVRSSANGLKFGSTNKGGFKNFKITNLQIFNTYRSAIALEDVDGGGINNILIDGIKAYNIGNVIFLRVGDRRSEGRTPSFSGVTIRNIYAEIASSKPDSGYRYEGPFEDLPRNIPPSVIAGLPEWRIKNVTLKNIEIVYPGGGNPHYAFRGISKQELESIPELPYAYPEFDMFKELPAWGFYVRHADHISFDHIVLKSKEKDYRPAIVLDDAKGIQMKDTKISEPENGKKKEIILNNSTTTK